MRVNGSLPWYDVAREPHEELFEYVRGLKSRQVRRRYELNVYQQLYNNSLATLPTSAMFSPNNQSSYQRMTENVIKSVCDSACSQVAKEKPRAFVLPNKGDYKLKRKCEQLTKFLDGAMWASGVYANADDVFRDSTIYGSGYLVLHNRDDEVKSDVVKVDEVIIDPVVGMYDRPDEISIEHPVPRRELLKRFPKHTKEINEAKMLWPGAMGFMSQADMVLTIETWKLGPTPDEPGRYVYAICNATLIDAPYEKDYIPVYRFHWTPPTYGCWGMGIACNLQGKQYMISNMMRDVAESQRLFAQPRVWIESSSAVSKHSIGNSVGDANYYTGTAPTFATPNMMASDFYAFLQWLIDSCYKQEGVSQLQAQSEKPAGLNAAVALRTYQDISTQRFALVGQRWERFFVDVAKGVVDLSRDIYMRNKNLAFKVPGRGFVETISWKDVNLKADQYDVMVFPTGWLPANPEGRLQSIQEWVSSGFMPRDVAIGQMNNPILYDWVAEETAARDNIEMCLTSIQDGEKYMAPDAVGNVELAIELSQSAILRARDPSSGVSEASKQQLQRFLKDALTMQKAHAAAQAPPPGAPPGTAPGAPGPAVGQPAAPPVAPFAPSGTGPVKLPAAAE